MPDIQRSLWSRIKSGIASLSPKTKQPNPNWGISWVYNPYTEDFPSTEQTISQPTVFACVRAIASTIGMLPWDVYEKDARGNRRNIQPANAPEGDVAWLLDVQPNPNMTAVTFKETLVAHAVTWGNGFAEIERDALGRPVWLWPITPDRVRVHRDDQNRLVYAVSGNGGGEVVLPGRDVLHLKGLGYDGYVGYSVVALAANTIGLAYSAEKYAANFYGAGGLPAGLLKSPTIMDPERKKAFAKAWDENYGKMNRGRKTAVLEAGFDYEAISLPNTDQQFLETRRFGVVDICRWFGVPPHMVYDLENAHYNNIEQQQIEFVQHSLLPWTIRLEQEANLKLFGRNQQGRRYTKINVMGLLRGDMKTRAEYYRQMLSVGILSVNEVRALEEMNTIGTVGDERYIQVNMTTLERVAEGDNNQPDPPPTESTSDDEGAVEERGEVEERQSANMSALFAPVIADTFERLRRKEINVLRPLLAKHGKDEALTLKEFQEQWIKANPMADSPLKPLATAYLGAAGLPSVETTSNQVVLAAMAEYEGDAIERVRGAVTGGLDSYGDGAAAASRYSARFVALCEEHRSHDNGKNGVIASVPAC